VIAMTNQPTTDHQQAAAPPETTVQSRREYLAGMSLGVEEFIAAASELPRDYVVTLLDNGVLDDALVEADEDGEPGIRPWGLALLYAVDELALLASGKKITHETAASAWTQLRPQVENIFSGIVVQEYDIALFEATLTPRDVDGAEPVKLAFMSRAVLRFYEFVFGEKYEAPA
jgi:hypothetical protein